MSVLKPRTNKFKAGDIVKIRVHIKRSDSVKWPELKQQARDWAKKHDLIADTIQPVILELNQLRAKEAFTKAPKKSDEQLLAEYAKARGVDELTVKTGLKLL